jgi:predicted phage tail protein
MLISVLYITIFYFVASQHIPPIHVHPDLEAARQKGHDVVDSAVDKAEQWKHKAKETASDLRDTVEHYGQEFQHTKDRVAGRANQAKDTTKGAVHEAGEKVQEGTANAYNKMRNMMMKQERKFKRALLMLTIR